MTDQDSASPIQFNLSTLLVMNFIAGVVIAYVRPEGGDRLLAAAVGIVVGGILGMIAGRWWGQTVPRVFWGVTAPAMMVILVAKGDLNGPAEVYVWPLVAAITVVIAIGNSNQYRRMDRYRRMVWASVIPAAIMMAATHFVVGCRDATLPNGMVVAIGGALSVFLVDAIGAAERLRGGMHRWIGLTLILVSIAASETLPRWIPGW